MYSPEPTTDEIEEPKQSQQKSTWAGSLETIQRVNYFLHVTNNCQFTGNPLEYMASTEVLYLELIPFLKKKEMIDKIDILRKEAKRACQIYNNTSRSAENERIMNYKTIEKIKEYDEQLRHGLEFVGLLMTKSQSFDVGIMKGRTY